MAVAVRNPAPTGAFFKGDAPHLVDMLVAACEKPVRNSPHAGFGRELVPCADAWLTAADDSKTPGRNLEARKNSSPQKAGRAQNARAPSSPARAARKSSDNKMPAPKRVSNNNNSHSTSIAIPTSNASTPARSSTDAGYMCPSVAASPKPEVLPMPTFGLLNRASGRTRSPSPSKAAAGMYYAPEPVIQGMFFRQQLVMA